MNEVSSIQHMFEVGASVIAFLIAFGGFVRLLSTVHIAMKLTQENKVLIERIIEKLNIFHADVLTLKVEMVTVKQEQNEMKHDIRLLNSKRIGGTES